MTGLFDRKLGKVEAAVSVLPNLPQESAVIPTVASAPKNLLEAVVEKLSSGASQTAIDGVMELTHADDELPMKANIKHAGSFTAAQVIADYNDSLGFSEVAEMLKNLCSWHYQHGCSLKGERAKQAFGTIRGEIEKEFQLEKEAKGLLPK